MRSVTGLVLGCLALSAGVGSSEDRRDVVTDRISVTVVEIPVQVLSKGEPVRGLTAADFEVYDRGVRQEIVSFAVLDVSEAPDVSAGDTAGVAVGARSRARHMLLLIDLDFTDWRELPRALLGARTLVLEQVHASDRIAVGFFSSFFGVQLLTGFLEDRLATVLALEVIEGIVGRDPAGAGRKLTELAELTGMTYENEEASPEIWTRVARQWATTAQTPAGESPREVVAAAEARDLEERSLGRSEMVLDNVVREATASPDLYDERRIRRVRELGRRFRELALSWSHVPDPKQVIFFSQGFPSRLLEDRRHSTRVLFRLDTAVKAFLETGWILQAIDVRGVPAFDEPVFDGNSLFHLAESTGGELYENFNRLGQATERILERSSVTYLLSIQPDVAADGSFHDLEVRLKGDRSVKLAHRPGYRAPRPGDRPARLETNRDVAQLILADREIEDFEVDLMVMPVPPVAGRATVPIVAEIPGEMLLETAFGDTVSMEVHAYGLDAGGGVQDLFIKRLDIDLGRDGKRLARGGLRVVGRLGLGVGDNEVRVLVRNLANDAISLTRQPVRIELLEPGAMALLPPLFVDRSKDWISLQLAPGSTGVVDFISAPAPMGEWFFPRLEPSFRPNRQQEVVLNLFYDAAEAPRLQMRVLTARGEEVDTPKIKLLERFAGEAGATGLLATLQAKGLEPGGYTLEVSLVDPASGERVTNSQRFRIVEPT